MHRLRSSGLTPSGVHRARHRPEVVCGRTAPDSAPRHYERHHPEQTTLYHLVQQHAAGFISHAEARTGAEQPRFVNDEFDAFLECGMLAHGFLRLRCGEQTYLAELDADGEETRTLRPLQAAAVMCRIAFGSRAGQKVLPLRGPTPREDWIRQPLWADIDGFSLHAAVRVEAHDRKQLELRRCAATSRALRCWRRGCGSTPPPKSNSSSRPLGAMERRTSS